MPKTTVRAAQSLSSNLERRLSAYATVATAAGIGVLVPSAHAKVIYTPAHQVIGRNQSANLDVNADGIVDFVVSVAPFCAGQFCSSFMDVVRQRDSNGSVEVIPYAPAYAAAPVRGGRHIGPKRMFSAGSYVLMAAVGSSGTSSFATATWTKGPWVNVKQHYLGLKFKIDGQTHYGWARFNVRIKGLRVVGTLTGYAYETKPNKPIVAGDTGNAAQARGAASLGDLALGSVPVKRP